jgi:ATP-dependent helicase/nuclease subunit A
MQQGTLTIYNASAGSGKTFMLTYNYLVKLFSSKYSYRRILAVTFTNKASGEMKSRILENLYRLSSGAESKYLDDLVKTTGKSEAVIRKEAKEILGAILHDYSRFSVSTIDSFFQKILRSFAREAGLFTGYNIQLDHTVVLSQAIDNLILSAASDEQLRKWLITYALSNIDDDKTWNLKEGISQMSEELFKENFKNLSEEEKSKIADKEFLHKYILKVRSLESDFEKTLYDFGKKALEIFTEFNLSDDLFYRKGSGVPGFIRSLAASKIKEPNSYVREIMYEPSRWSTRELNGELESALKAGLEETVKSAIRYYDENKLLYNTARAIRKNIYALGILSDVFRNVHEITTNENSFLLSDAGEFLSMITGSGQIPFIYEKTGSSFENFMIDEFQDTSVLQWSNFKPLIDNSMAEGNDNLIVGDVKQSIYRWRNSNWRILGSLIADSASNNRIITENLATNWRSRPEIIRFNNTLFSLLPELLDKNSDESSGSGHFTRLYSAAVQTDPGKRHDGYVRIEFVDDDRENPWKDIVLTKLAPVLEELFEKGYKPSDIGILVRDGKEGAAVLDTLMKYVNAEANHTKFSIISDESLLLANSPVIRFIISVLSVIVAPDDDLALAAMIRYYLVSAGIDKAESVFLGKDALNETIEKHLPHETLIFIESLRKLSLLEATENIIRFFDLGNNENHVAFLNTFQDHVITFTSGKDADINTFLNWWDESGSGKSIQLAGSQDSVRILTVHKSKGLEFNVVIVPFLCWKTDHPSTKQPLLWVSPAVEPFNELGVVPVKYGSYLSETIFANDYAEEKNSILLDNLNLLYVAFTRARDVLYAFAEESNAGDTTIPGLLKLAFTADIRHPENGLSLTEHFDTENGVFESGNLNNVEKSSGDESSFIKSEYKVSQPLSSLRLKLHGENYFAADSQEIRKKINHGKLMHEVFEGINNSDDVDNALTKLVLDGKVSTAESVVIASKIRELLKDSQVAGWFSKENTVLTEAAILLQSGNTKRPDRIIISGEKAIIIDFKFGRENEKYKSQLRQYSELLSGMGYKDIECYLWYVDKNKIQPV